MSYFRKYLELIAGYQPGEQPQDGQFIKLNTNENPYPPSPLVVETLMENLNKHRLSCYPSPLCDELREQVSAVYGYPPDWILVGNGSDELLSIIFRAFLGKDDRVSYPYPTYTLYRVLALLQEANYEEIPFEKEYSLPKKILTVQAQLKVVCNPNSPTGTFLSTPVIEDLLKSSSCPVVVDEAYVDFARENALSLIKKYPHLIVLRTLSKSYSLAGIRVGFLIAHPEMIRGLLKVKDSYNVSWFSQKAATAALQDLHYMMSNVEKIKRTRRDFSQAMSRLGYSVLPSEANFVMVQRPGDNLESEYLYLKKNHILVRYFSEWPDSMRISIGTDSNMQLLIQVLSAMLKDGKK
ncbi:MAG TPA: histidinol-phosphate transaminase [Candidatus Atribacteria bacterium]|nr:histidinol-phosphate transaminase [Candidatus Atribacteria bacterium]HCU21396.1 histidinol-phosphate transaminase [Candidatus Atribacteria bacterium]